MVVVVQHSLSLAVLIECGHSSGSTATAHSERLCLMPAGHSYRRHSSVWQVVCVPALQRRTLPQWSRERERERHCKNERERERERASWQSPRVECVCVLSSLSLSIAVVDDHDPLGNSWFPSAAECCNIFFPNAQARSLADFSSWRPQFLGSDSIGATSAHQCTSADSAQRTVPTTLAPRRTVSACEQVSEVIKARSRCSQSVIWSPHSEEARPTHRHSLTD